MNPEPITRRLADLPAAGASGAERHAAALLRGVRAPEDLDAARMTRLEATITAKAAAAPVAFGALGLKPALAALGAIAVAGIAAAAGILPGFRAAEPTGDVVPVILRAPSGLGPAMPTKEPAPAADVPIPVGATTSPAPPAADDDAAAQPGPPRVDRAPVARAIAPAAAVAASPAAPSALAEESALLGRALGMLRQDHNPAGALQVLRAYRAKFPRGALAPEADVAQVDALLALGRRGQALRHLDGMNLAASPRGTELRVLRGELRAKSGRCQDALADFDTVIAVRPDLDLEERAVIGRASCGQTP